MQINQEPLAVSANSAAKLLGISSRTLWTLVYRGELPSRRIGRRRVFRVVDLEAFLRRDHATHPRESAPAPEAGEK